MSGIDISTAINLPLDLRQAMESGNCVLFLGAGIGDHLHRPDGSSAPQAFELAEAMAKHFGLIPKVVRI